MVDQSKIDDLVSGFEYGHAFYERVANSPNSLSRGVIEVDIDGWHYWATYSRNPTWSIEHPTGEYGPYYFDVIWFSRTSPENTRNPYDCGAFQVPATWMEGTCGLLLRLLCERVIAKVGDWSLIGEKE